MSCYLLSCSHDEKKVIDKAQSKPAQPQQYSMGPTKSSAIFIDKTQEYGLEGVVAVHLYAVDVNHDGHTDLVALDDFFAAPKFYFFNPSTKKFQIGASPFDSIVRASYLNFLDLNHDGIYDVIVGTLNQKSDVTQYPPRIYKGEILKGQLHYQEQAVLPVGLTPTASISAIDFDLDGQLDLFLSNWFSYKDNNPQPVPDLLIKGEGFNFRDQSSSLKGEYEFNRSTKNYSNSTPTFGASICDLDKNGFPDILTTNSNGYFNKLWMNVDGQNFVNYGSESGYGGDEEGTADVKGGGNSFFSLCGDYNNDGLIDIAVGTVSKDTDSDTRDRSSMLTGSTNAFPPKFIRSEFYRTGIAEKWSEGDRRGVWLDYNLDGRPDLIIDNSGFPPDSRLVFFEQQKDHAYDDKAMQMGVDIINPSGTVSLDINHDGIMDFITGQSNTRAGDLKNHLYVFENQTKRQKKGSIRFHLRGKRSNYYGLNSSLWLKTDKHIYFGNVEYNSGSLPSQNEEGVYFAYDTEVPKKLDVNWSYAIADRLGRLVPMTKTYSLSKFNLKGKHHEFTVCEDGRLLKYPKNCD